jgi:hypothetical protein
VGEFLKDLRIRLRSEKADLLDRITETGKLEEADEEELARRSPSSSTTSAPTSTSTATRSRPASPTGSGPRRSGQAEPRRGRDESAETENDEEKEGRPRLIGDGALT